MPARARVLMLLGMFGAALFYGDGMITPAISVLSAVEGLEVATPRSSPMSFRSRWSCSPACSRPEAGHRARGALFGPVMVRRGSQSSALLGVVNIAHTPQRARGARTRATRYEFSPTHGSLGFFSLGAVVLVGHRRRGAVRRHGPLRAHADPARLDVLVLPALVLNYFGQGALLLADPEAIENPFYLLAPEWALYPLVVLATVATVIASQAVISGAFSITQQAMQLGYCRAWTIQHTSEPADRADLPARDQLDAVRWRRRAGAGLRLVDAIWPPPTASPSPGTMAITTILAFVVARVDVEMEPALRAPRCSASSCSIDLGFFSANLLKVSTAAGSRSRSASCVFIADVDVEARPRAAASRARGRTRSRSTPSSRARRSGCADAFRAPRCS